MVSTPIGNLEDITLRALRTLREADVIACEDTRHTGRLLRHFEIRKPLVSYHEHNEARRAQVLVARAKAGERVAVVSDAGTPGICDPGYRIVKEALDAGVPVTAVPGASAVIAALAVSGLPTRNFRFLGFLPAKKAARREALRGIAGAADTTIFYEAPHRILGTLADLDELVGSAEIVIARELTKLHEEFLRGTSASLRRELSGRPSIKGELVVLVGPHRPEAADPGESLQEHVARLERDGVRRMDAIKMAARARRIPKREAYSRLQAETAQTAPSEPRSRP